MVMTPDGYFRTGDIGVMAPDGLITIVDRKKDMISVSGFKVFPNEVEAVVAHHPGVLECAVIGVPDEKTGEAVKLFVVKKDPNLTAADLIKFCHAELTSYKVPKHIEFRTELAENECRQDLAPCAARTSGRNEQGSVTAIAEPKDVLAFWRAAGPDKWFAKDDAFDAAYPREVSRDL